jgi:hypothetical protein
VGCANSIQYKPIRKATSGEARYHNGFFAKHGGSLHDIAKKLLGNLLLAQDIPLKWKNGKSTVDNRQLLSN